MRAGRGWSWAWAAGGGAGAAAAGVALWLWLGGATLPEGVLYANGQLEAVEVRVSAEVTGRVTETRLEEGRRVEEGELLARIDPSDLRAELAVARARIEAIRQSRKALEEELRTWRHHLRTARADLERTRTLRARDSASERRVDQAENAYEEARGRVGALEAKLQEAAAEREAAERRVDVLELQLEKTTLRAPITGTVLTRAVETGELATPGRVVAVLADTSQLDLRVFVSERHVGRIALGDPARVRIDAFPERSFPARVARVDDRAQYTPREVHLPEDRVRMVFGVTLEVANPEGLLKSGMPADAWVKWGDGATWPERLVVPR